MASAGTTGYSTSAIARSKPSTWRLIAAATTTSGSLLETSRAIICPR
jgi:hypothetical protein